MEEKLEKKLVIEIVEFDVLEENQDETAVFYRSSSSCSTTC